MIGRSLAAFRFLGLLAEANEPTDEWRALSDVHDDAYPQMLGRIVRAAYSDIFVDIDPPADGQERIRAAFQKFQPKSQIDRMASLPSPQRGSGHLCGDNYLKLRWAPIQAALPSSAHSARPAGGRPRTAPAPPSGPRR